MMGSLRDIARALGGDVVRGGVLVPGPGHGPRDRSLSVKISPGSPDGFLVHSFANDPFDACRDHVAGRLGLATEGTGRHRRRVPNSPPVRGSSHGTDLAPIDARTLRATELWAEARDLRGTVVEQYLRSRGLELPDGADAIQFHPRCPWRDHDRDETIRVPAMVAALRTIAGDHLVGIHRTALTPGGVKIGRRMLGRASGAAVKLDADETVTHGLHIGEGIETTLASRMFDFRPSWALGSADAVRTFPILPGVESLTIFEENDATSKRSVEECADRWHRAGREVTIVAPNFGSDMNDLIGGVT